MKLSKGRTKMAGTDRLFAFGTNPNLSPHYDPKHDPYFKAEHYPEGTSCPDCGAMIVKGSFRWSEDTTAVKSAKECPACLRIKEKVAAGVVLLSGNFLSAHENELALLIHNIETREKSEHPLQRIIEFNRDDNNWEILTTYEHIARRIGDALYSAFKGDLDIEYPRGEKAVLVTWHRD